MKKNKSFLKWINKGKRFTSAGFSWLFTKNKVLQLEVVWVKDVRRVVEFWIDWSHKTDHAGLIHEVGLLWLSFSFKIQDKRNWDHENDRWEVEPESHVPFRYF